MTGGAGRGGTPTGDLDGDGESSSGCTVTAAAAAVAVDRAAGGFWRGDDDDDRGPARDYHAALYYYYYYYDDNDDNVMSGGGHDYDRGIDVGLKRFLAFFYFGHVFNVFRKNVGKVQSGKQINEKHFQNNSNEIDLRFIMGS